MKKESGEFTGFDNGKGQVQDQNILNDIEENSKGKYAQLGKNEMSKRI